MDVHSNNAQISPRNGKLPNSVKPSNSFHSMSAVRRSPLAVWPKCYSSRSLPGIYCLLHLQLLFQLWISLTCTLELISQMTKHLRSFFIVLSITFLIWCLHFITNRFATSKRFFTPLVHVAAALRYIKLV